MEEKSRLSELQYDLKRDPDAYKDDFKQLYDRYKALEESFSSAPSQYIEALDQLVLFISQVVHLYSDYVYSFSWRVIRILLSRSFGMDPSMRQAYMKTFMRLKTRDVIYLNVAVDVAFKLHRCQDKVVRRTMRNFIISDIKRMNKKQRNNKLNLTTQLFLAKTIKDSNSTVAREAVFILLRLFKKNIWNDSRTANIIADACFAKRKKVYAPAVRFFLGQDKVPDEKDSDSDSDMDVNKETRIKQLRLGHRVGSKTKKREKRLERSIKQVNKKDENKGSKKDLQMTNFSAITMLHDEQTFTERLFRKLERCSDRFEIRLLILDLISRLIGLNKLVVLNFYPFIQKFLRPHQRECTRLLLFAAQASHDEVPPDVMEPLIRTIADNFITERASSEAIAVGLNAVREICARCPYAVTPDLLSDLVQYRTYKNQNVVSSARSLIRLYRQLNPAILPRKERGRPTEAQMETIKAISVPELALSFGQAPMASSIPGAEALVLAESLAAVRDDSDELQDHSKANSNGDQCVEEEATDDDDVVDKSDASSEDSDDSGESDSESEGDSGHSDDEVDEEEQNQLANKHGSTSIEKKKLIKDKKEPEEADSGDEGWIDVEHTSDEEDREAAAMEKLNMTPNDLRSKAIEVASSRVFTQEEFEAMRKYQQKKQKRFASLGSGNKRTADSMLLIDSDDEGQDDRLVNLSAITRLAKRPKQNKADRLEAVEEGRAGRPKYGFKINRMNPHSSTTNREKSKKKSFQMIKHKVRGKMKRSFREKQIILRDKLKNMMKHMRH